jgi:hypothetical protein
LLPQWFKIIQVIDQHLTIHAADLEQPLDTKHLEELIEHTDRTQILSRPPSDNNLLDYLAYNDPKTGAALQVRYQESCRLRPYVISLWRSFSNQHKNPFFNDSRRRCFILPA